VSAPSSSARRRAIQANLLRVHIGGHLIGNLGLGEPHRLGHLHRRRYGAELLQSGDPVNPNRVRHERGVGDNRGQLLQHLIKACGHRIRGQRLDRLVILKL
jgi:hypothetical protein